MTYSVPVMEPARGETRKVTRSATSVGLDGRPIGMPPSEAIRPLFSGLIVGAFGLCQPIDHSDGGFGLDPARCDPDDANTLRANLLRQAFAVVRERRLCRCVGDGGLWQRQLPLDRRDVDDYAGALLKHLRQQGPVKSDCGK